MFEDVVVSFGEQWDDAALQRHDKSSSHRRVGHLALPRHRGGTSWSHQRS